MWEKIKFEWERNPVNVVAAAGVAATGVAALLNALSAAQGRRAYARQINHKIKYGR